MKALSPGGVAFFQVPTYKEEYHFILEEYLGNQSPQDEMEMHVLPQHAVFEIVREEKRQTTRSRRGFFHVLGIIKYVSRSKIVNVIGPKNTL